LNPLDKEAQSQRVLIVRKMAQVGIKDNSETQFEQTQLRV
jgi:hypothetical protein